MKTLFLFLAVIFFTNEILPQSFNINGIVKDSISKKPLISANVIVKHLRTLETKGTATDRDGKFKIENLNRGRYELVISYIGYKSSVKEFALTNNSVDFETIFLSPSEIEIQDVEVVDKMPPIVQNADTTEFNAAAFKTNTDASAEDLITKLPGITVQDGQVQTQGENVQRVLVDGKPFFGDDPNAVLRNIPAEIIDKIQVFDQLSDQSQFTGFDDGNASKTINIITTVGLRQGTFGKFSGGYGNTDKYLSGGNINFFNDEQRITFLGQLNNINQQNFSSEDLIGVTAQSFGGRSGGSGQRGMRGRGGGGGNWSGGRSGGNSSDFLVNIRNGITQTKAAGINYIDKWGTNIEVSGSYFFNLTNNNALTNTNRDYLLTNSTQNYSELNSSASDNINHRLNFRLEYQIDSLNSILFRPRLSLQNNDGSSFTSGFTSTPSENLNRTNNLFNSNFDAIDYSSNLLYRKRFELRGRTLSLSINNSYRRNNGDNSLYSESYFYGTNPIADTLDQIASLDANGTTISSNIVYTEPFGDNSQLQLTVGTSFAKDDSEQKTFYNINGNNNYLNLDSSLSNVYLKNYNTQSFGLGYRYQFESLMINTNISYNQAQLINDNQFPINVKTEKKFQSVLPSVWMRYNFTRDENIRFNYNTRNNDPSVSQLQNVLNNSNPLQLRIGNSDLQQDYRHTFTLRYSKINIETRNSFFVLFGGTLIQNYIGNNTIIAENDTVVLGNIPLLASTQLTYPENIDGYFNLRTFMNYSFPVEFLLSNLNLNVNVGHTKTPALINGLINNSNTTNYGLGFTLSSNIGKELDFTLSSNNDYNVVKSSLPGRNNDNYFVQRNSLKFFWLFWKGFSIQTEFTHRYNGGLTGSFDPNSYLLNASLGKKIFAKDQGEIKLTFFDILKMNNNVTRNVTEYYTEDVTSNVIGQYVILSFIYNLRVF